MGVRSAPDCERITRRASTLTTRLSRPSQQLPAPQSDKPTPASSPFPHQPIAAAQRGMALLLSVPARQSRETSLGVPVGTDGTQITTHRPHKGRRTRPRPRGVDYRVLVAWVRQNFGCGERAAKDALGILVTGGWAEARGGQSDGRLRSYSLTAGGHEDLGTGVGRSAIRGSRKRFSTCSKRAKRVREHQERNGLIDYSRDLWLQTAGGLQEIRSVGAVNLRVVCFPQRLEHRKRSDKQPPIGAFRDIRPQFIRVPCLFK